MAGAILALAGGAVAWVAALLNGQAPLHSVANVHADLSPRLSSHAAIWLPGTEGYALATDRWSPRKNPSFDVVVDVGTEKDVAHVVRAPSQDQII